MKFICQKSCRAMLLIGMIWICYVFAPPVAQGAEAHAWASAELVDPAIIDTSKLLGAAAADSGDPPPDHVGAQQVEPEVKLVVEAGVAFLTIDYN